MCACDVEYFCATFSFTGVAEAVLLHHWLTCGHQLPKYGDVAFGELLEATEYLGGLADFTGEVGRIGVAAATRRDTELVKGVLAVCQTVERLWIDLEVGWLQKKSGMLQSNVRKLEQLRYDLTLEKGGGRKMAADEPAPATAEPDS